MESMKNNNVLVGSNSTNAKMDNKMTEIKEIIMHVEIDLFYMVT